jgi:hypothetical protein
MSHDRVEFKLSADQLGKSGMYGVILAAFGLRLKISYHGCQDITIICRPSQFARFLILRNDAGIPNSFMQLEARLFLPKPEAEVTVYDTSRNPNNFVAATE